MTKPKITTHTPAMAIQAARAVSGAADDPDTPKPSRKRRAKVVAPGANVPGIKPQRPAKHRLQWTLCEILTRKWSGQGRMPKRTHRIVETIAPLTPAERAYLREGTSAARIARKMAVALQIGAVAKRC